MPATIDVYKRQDYEVQELCSLMGVSRSGYYKWRKRDKSTRDLRREAVIALVSEVHKAHPSHGYRWVAAFIPVSYTHLDVYKRQVHGNL